jgi:hypothetical protein
MEFLRRIPKRLINELRSIYFRVGQPIASVFPKVISESETAGVSELRMSSPSSVKETTQVHMLWVGDSLSRLESLSINSFIANGFKVNLWSYGAVKNVPTNVHVRNASEIIPKNQIFVSKTGSLGPFSDFFRYTLFSKYSGLWSDVDVICDIDESRFRSEFASPFIATERHSIRGMVKVNGNLIHVPDINNFSILNLALGVSVNFEKSQIHQLELGPQLLTSLAITYPSLRPKLVHPSLTNPINHWDSPRSFLSRTPPLLEQHAFIHCFNEFWSRAKVDKTLKFPIGSLMWQLEQKYS